MGLFWFDLAVLHGYYAVGGGGYCGVVGYYYECGGGAVAEIGDYVHDFVSVRGVEGACGLVGKNYFRGVHECPGYGHSLFFASRELGGFMGGPAFYAEQGE